MTKKQLHDGYNLAIERGIPNNPHNYCELEAMNELSGKPDRHVTYPSV